MAAQSQNQPGLANVMSHAKEKEETCQQDSLANQCAGFLRKALWVPTCSPIRDGENWVLQND
jgi:hypothetical protein